MLLILVLLAVSGCGQGAQEPSKPGMANPASVNCDEKGGKLDIRKDTDGNEVGICVFDDGSECEEWSFFRGECQPGQGKMGGNIANPASVYCEDNGGQSEIRKNADGSEYGMCVFDDGSECDEWKFFRNECKPGE
jgi:uncharacterized protein